MVDFPLNYSNDKIFKEMYYKLLPHVGLLTSPLLLCLWSHVSSCSAIAAATRWK